MRSRIAALNALREVLLGQQPRAALLLGAGLHDLGIGYNKVEPGSLGHVKAEAAGHADDITGVAEYLLRVLRRLDMPNAQAGAGEAPAPALQEHARDLAAWLEAAAGLGAGAPRSPEQPMDAGLPDYREPLMRPMVGGERSRLGAFLAHLRTADAGLHSDLDPVGHAQRGQQAEAAAAGDGAGVPAGGPGVKAEPSSGAAESFALDEAACKAEPDVDMDCQRDAAHAFGTAAAAGWAAAALRARAVHLACTGPNHDLGIGLGHDSVLELFASAPDTGGCGLSDLAFGAWLCRGGGSDARGSDGRAGSRKRKREADADQGAPASAAPSAATDEGPAAIGDVRWAADDQYACGRSLPCDLADAVARHGLPSPALLAQALARLLDERAWERVASLERAAAARADPSPDPDPHPSPGLQGSAARSAAECARPAASAAGADGAAGPAGRDAARDAECRQLLRCGVALAAFVSGLLDAPSSAAKVLPFVLSSCSLPLILGTSCLPSDTDLTLQDRYTELLTSVPHAPGILLFRCGRKKEMYIQWRRRRRQRSRRRRASAPCRRFSAAWAPRSRRRRRRRHRCPSPAPLPDQQRLPRSQDLPWRPYL